MRSVVSFLALFATWLALSGHFSPYFVVSGLLCSAATVALMRRLAIFGEGPWPLDLPRLVLAYLPWLAWAVVKANLDVARRVWLPGRPIEPRIVRVPYRLRTEAGLALFANSVTLTPGTVTMAIEDEALVVHCLSEESALGVLDPALHDRVARLERPA